MSGCGFESRLDAFHGVQFAVVESALVAKHVADCAGCGAAIEQMRQMSMLMTPRREFAASQVDADEIARLHDAVDREMNRAILRVDSSFWRTAGVISGLAASILIVASAWLMEAQPTARTQIVQPAPLQPWEELAMGSRVDLLPHVGPEMYPDHSALADANTKMTDWMLENLKGQEGR